MIHAVKVDRGPVVNGSLDDPVWEKASPFRDLRQVEPVPGHDPSEQTEIRVLYDSRNLYLGIRCYDREPRRIAGNTMIHDEIGDNGNDEDMVSILIDPFQDKRNAYIFFVNPRGARSEGFASGEHASLSWDGIWNARCRVDEQGWTAEVSIPFKTLSFKPGLNNWGLNVERQVARKQEVIRLSGISLNSFFNNPSEAAILDGISGVRQGTGTTVRPYALAGLTRDHTGSGRSENRAEAGLDLYQNITPNMVASLSYNTDFAETEVDERRVNLTRFPLYYPEKRTFFLEGSDIFDFGPQGTSRDFMPFFSRKIGLYEGQPVPVTLGAKMFGKLGNTSLSVLDVQTGESGSLGSTNLFAGRVYQNILKESKAGLIFTRGDQGGGQNSLAGADLVLSTSRLLGQYNLTVGSWMVYNWNEKKGGQKEAYGIKVDYPNDLFDINLAYHHIGDSIDPAMGFLPRRGVHNLFGGFSYMPRPEKGWVGRLVRQFFFEFRPSFYWDLSGRVESMRLFLAPLNFRTESGEHIEFNLTPQREVLPVDFEVSDGVVLPRGDYSYISYSVETSTASHRRVQAELDYTFGEFYSGRLQEAEIGLSFRYNGYLTLGGSATLVRGNLPQGRFAENIYQFRLNLFLNPDLGLTNYLQADERSGELVYNGRFFWQIRPGNIVYLVYNSGMLKRWDPEERYQIQQQKLSLKVQVTIR